MTTNLKQGERLDDLQIKGYEIIQHPGKFVLEWIVHFCQVL